MRCFGCPLPLNLTKKEEGGEEEEDEEKGGVEKPALNRGSGHIVFLLCLQDKKNFQEPIVSREAMTVFINFLGVR